MIDPVRVVDPAPAPRPAVTPSPTRLLGGSIEELRAALAMLTRLSLPGSPSPRTGVRAYAVVGALLGLTTFLPLLALGTAVPVAAAFLAFALLAALSGGLHLDGLADTFDALAATGPDAAERARKDPAIGAAGAAALVVVLGIDVAALTQLLATAGPFVAGVACVVAGSLSRLLPAVVARLNVTAAADSGLGAWFVRRTSTMDVVVVVATGFLITLAGALAIDRPVLAVGWLLAGIGSVGVGLGLVRGRRQLDGDLLGASVEIAVALILLVTAIGFAGVLA